MLIIISLGLALFLTLAAVGSASVINSKFGGNVQRKHLQVIMLPVIICAVIFLTPLLMRYFGFN